MTIMFTPLPTPMIVSCYESHRQSGGDADPVAKDLIFELQAKNNAGQFVSHQLGKS